MQISEVFAEGHGLSLTEAARRAQIVDATIEVLAELGYAKTSFARIMERASLSSSRLITYHFGTKADLMRQVLNAVISAKERFLLDTLTGRGDRVALLRQHIRTEVEFLASHPKHVRAMLEIGTHCQQGGDDLLGPVVRDQRVGRLGRQLEQGLREGVFAGFSPDVMAMAIAQAVDGVAAEHARNPQLDLERYGRELAVLFVRAATAAA